MTTSGVGTQYMPTTAPGYATRPGPTSAPGYGTGPEHTTAPGYGYSAWPGYTTTDSQFVNSGDHPVPVVPADDERNASH